MNTNAVALTATRRAVLAHIADRTTVRPAVREIHWLAAVKWLEQNGLVEFAAGGAATTITEAGRAAL